MQDLIINHYPWSYAQLWATPIRYNVFVREQKLPLKGEFDNLDTISTHAIAFCGNQPIATARLSPNHQIGRVAVQKPWRDQGIGMQIMKAIIGLTEKFNLHLIAQMPTVGFYERLGFTCSGNVFLESGIEHIKMVRQGRQQAA